MPISFGRNGGRWRSNLNIVELGPGIFGVEAAAEHYFKRSARDLSPGQAALLVSALPNPTERNPARPSRFVSARAHAVAAHGRAAGAYIGCVTEIRGPISGYKIQADRVRSYSGQPQSLGERPGGLW
jgi:hypothetical protein